jgi:hypothetical protein
MGNKEKVRITLEEKGFVTKVIVETLQRTTLHGDDNWVRNLEVTAKEVEIRPNSFLE